MLISFFFSYSGQASGGHYYSFIRNKDSDGEFRWYKFDDGDVTEIKMEDEEELKVSLLFPIIDGAAVLIQIFWHITLLTCHTKRFLFSKVAMNLIKTLYCLLKTKEFWSTKIHIKDLINSYQWSWNATLLKLLHLDRKMLSFAWVHNLPSFQLFLYFWKH